MKLFLSTLFVFVLSMTLNGQVNFSTDVLFSQTGSSHIHDLFLVGDLNIDGNEDIIYSLVQGNPLYNKGVGLFKGNGNLEFTSEHLSNSIENGVVDIMDIDNDGDMDLLCGLSILYQEEDSTFTRKRIPELNNKDEIRAGVDLNGDGLFEIIIDNTDFDRNDSLIVYKNINGIDFERVVIENSYEENGYVTFGDFDNDDDIDILMAIESEDTEFIIYENKGDLLFEKVVLPFLDLNVASNYAEWVDIDGDDDLDIVGFDIARRMFWLENTGGSYKHNSTFGANAPYANADFVDLDLDGDLDMAGLYATGILSVAGNVGYCLNDGAGKFGPSQFVFDYDISDSFFLLNKNIMENYLQIADLNNDGLPDLLVNNVIDRRVFYVQNTTILSANDLSNTIELSLSPNPCIDYLDINFIDAEYPNLRLDLTDVEGRIVYSRSKLSSGEIDTKALVPGLYICRIMDERSGLNAVYKIIKQ